MKAHNYNGLILAIEPYLRQTTKMLRFYFDVSTLRFGDYISLSFLMPLEVYAGVDVETAIV